MRRREDRRGVERRSSRAGVLAPGAVAENAAARAWARLVQGADAQLLRELEVAPQQAIARASFLSLEEKRVLVAEGVRRSPTLARIAGASGPAVWAPRSEAERPNALRPQGGGAVTLAGSPPGPAFPFVDPCAHLLAEASTVRADIKAAQADLQHAGPRDPPPPGDPTQRSSRLRVLRARTRGDDRAGHTLPAAACRGCRTSRAAAHTSTGSLASSHRPLQSFASSRSGTRTSSSWAGALRSTRHRGRPR